MKIEIEHHFEFFEAELNLLKSIAYRGTVLIKMLTNNYGEIKFNHILCILNLTE